MLSPPALEKLRAQFAAGSADDAATLATIASVYKATGELLDPHTAVGVSVGRALHKDASGPLVTLATTHPAKFPDAVTKATGVHPRLPPHLGDLMTRTERGHDIANDVKAVKSFIESQS